MSTTVAPVAKTLQAVFTTEADDAAAAAGFIRRVRDNAVWTVIEERPLTPQARAGRRWHPGNSQAVPAFKKHCQHCRQQQQLSRTLLGLTPFRRIAF
jgi:hypothetical protein